MAEPPSKTKNRSFRASGRMSMTGDARRVSTAGDGDEGKVSLCPLTGCKLALEQHIMHAAHASQQAQSIA